MIQLSHQPYPLPSTSSSATLIIHPLSPSHISAITTSPYSRYSKLASLITQAQSLATPASSSNANPISPTISLPPLNPLAVKFLLRFLETGDSTPGEASTIRKADIRRAFEVLGVEFPPGFDYTEGFVDGLGLSSKEYLRGKEDYSSPEIYEAKMRMEMEEGFRIDVVNQSGGPSGASHSSSAHRAGGHGSRSVASPPSYAVSEFTNPRSSALSLYSKGNKGDTKHPEKSTPGPQSEFHAALQDSLLTKLFTLILSHIQPALTTQAQLGIFRGSFILLADPEEPVPMNQIITSSPYEKIGGVTLGYREVIYLPTPTHGVNDGFSQVFLVQSAVVRGIKSTVNEALGVPPTPPRVPTPPPPPTPPPQKKKGWFGFGKKKSVKVAPPPAPVVIEPEPSTVVDVRVEDIWIRKENEDGLWGTRCVKGVVVWVEVKQEGYGV